jgi:transposase
MAATPRKPYQSDLTEEQWAILQPLLPPAKPGGRPREVDMREVITPPQSGGLDGCEQP